MRKINGIYIPDDVKINGKTGEDPFLRLGKRFDRSLSEKPLIYRLVDFCNTPSIKNTLYSLEYSAGIYWALESAAKGNYWGTIGGLALLVNGLNRLEED